MSSTPMTDGLRAVYAQAIRERDEARQELRGFMEREHGMKMYETALAKLAYEHTSVACKQLSDRDDQIIADHLRRANCFLRRLLKVDSCPTCEGDGGLWTDDHVGHGHYKPVWDVCEKCGGTGAVRSPTQGEP